jgi:hypothetical protein
VVTFEESTPPQLSPRLDRFHWVELTARVERTITTVRSVWMQDWAAPLLERHLMSGALVEYSSPASVMNVSFVSFALRDLMDDVGPVQTWQVPTIFVVPVGRV